MAYHKVTVIHTGHFYINDDAEELRTLYEANNVKQAVNNQLNWYLDGSSGHLDEIVTEWQPPIMAVLDGPVDEIPS